MAGDWTCDGAVQDHIDNTVKDAVLAAGAARLDEQKALSSAAREWHASMPIEEYDNVSQEIGRDLQPDRRRFAGPGASP